MSYYKVLRTYLHYLITFFILFGGLVGIYTKNYNITKVHIIFNLIVIIHWLTNDNKCFLSECDNHDDNEYSLSLFEKIGISIDKNNKEFINVITYSTVIIPLLFSVRYLINLNAFNLN